ncbi:nuclear fragile X mental retardation-interacting protein 1-like, partial [Seriola lalandi dorsalis]
MNEPGHYPSPDFGCPPPNTIQPFQQHQKHQQHQQQQPSSSSFHPNMWSWCETPSEPSWDYRAQAGWHHGAAPAFGFPPGRGNHGPKRPYGQNFGREWHQGGRQNHGPLSNHGKKQRNKKEPEYSHYCDTCDRGFKNQEKYDEHMSQHVK